MLNYLRQILDCICQKAEGVEEPICNLNLHIQFICQIQEDFRLLCLQCGVMLPVGKISVDKIGSLYCIAFLQLNHCIIQS